MHTTIAPSTWYAKIVHRYTLWQKVHQCLYRKAIQKPISICELILFSFTAFSQKYLYRLFLVIAMYLQASTIKVNESKNHPHLDSWRGSLGTTCFSKKWLLKSFCPLCIIPSWRDVLPIPFSNLDSLFFNFKESLPKVYLGN